MSNDNLLDDLRQAASPPPPKQFQPGVIYAGGAPKTITTPPLEALNSEEEWEEAVAAMGVPVPEGHRLVLVQAAYAYNAAAWQREHEDKGVKHSAFTAPSHRWSYKFDVVPKSARDDSDLAAMMKEAARKVRQRRPLEPKFDDTSMVISLADFQVGKSDVLGGTPELLERSETALRHVLRAIKRQKPSELLLVDPGDSTEGFNSAPNAARVNDLQEVEALRVWRRLFWRWISEIAKLGIPMKVISVPSNHCRNRAGKQELGPINDDWGLEVLSQVADMASVNAEAYAHVEFIVPREHEEHVTITLAGGKVISIAHGHRANKPEALTTWVKKHGRRELGVADIILVGHFHHLRVITFGDNQTLFLSPTMDGGSSHYTPSSGESSDPGVLTVMVDSKGWYDLDVAWAV